MTRDLQPKPRDLQRQEALRAAAERQIVTGERIQFAMVVGKQHVAITDRRLVITRMGMMGQGAESYPLGAITGLATTTSEGRIVLLQLAVPGRSWGEVTLQGEDLSEVHAALVRSMPLIGGA